MKSQSGHLFTVPSSCSIPWYHKRNHPLHVHVSKLNNREILENLSGKSHFHFAGATFAQKHENYQNCWNENRCRWMFFFEVLMNASHKFSQGLRSPWSFQWFFFWHTGTSTTSKCMNLRWETQAWGILKSSSRDTEFDCLVATPPKASASQIGNIPNHSSRDVGNKGRFKWTTSSAAAKSFGFCTNNCELIFLTKCIGWISKSKKPSPKKRSISAIQPAFWTSPVTQCLPAAGFVTPLQDSDGEAVAKKIRLKTTTKHKGNIKNTQG